MANINRGAVVGRVNMEQNAGLLRYTYQRRLFWRSRDGGGVQMLRKIISIPEGVYYRGRFRATTAWSKVSQRKGEGDSTIADEQGTHGIDEPNRPILERVVSGKTGTKALQMRPSER
jgi:hypothetical protein